MNTQKYLISSTDLHLCYVCVALLVFDYTEPNTLARTSTRLHGLVRVRIEVV